MTTIFVYVCFILGLLDVCKAPFSLYKLIKSKKKGDFLNGKLRNNNGNSGDSGRGTDRNDGTCRDNLDRNDVHGTDNSDSDDGNYRMSSITDN